MGVGRILNYRFDFFFTKSNNKNKTHNMIFFLLECHPSRKYIAANFHPSLKDKQKDIMIAYSQHKSGSHRFA